MTRVSRCLLGALLLAGIAYGAVLDSYLSDSGDDTLPCSSGAPCLTLAFAMAEHSGGNDDVTYHLGAGMFMEAEPADWCTSCGITIRGAGRDQTVVDYSGLNGARAAMGTNNPTSVTLVLEDLTFTDFTSSNSSMIGGGSIAGGSMSRVKIANFDGSNTEGFETAAVHLEPSQPNPVFFTVNDCVFENNVGGLVGGMYLGLGGIGGQGNVTDSVFTDCTGDSAGALLVDSSDSAAETTYLLRNTFLDCSGSCLRLEASFGMWHAVVEDSEFNAGSAAQGGGLWAATGTLTMRDSTVVECEASDEGGALYLENTDATLVNVEVSNTESGGALTGAIHTDSMLTLSGSTSLQNSFGGGIYTTANMTSEVSVFVTSNQPFNVLCDDNGGVETLDCRNCTVCVGTGGTCLLTGVDEAEYPDTATDVSEQGCICASPDLLHGGGDCGQCQDPSLVWEGEFDDGACIDATPGEVDAGSAFGPSGVLVAVALSLAALIAG